MTDLNEFLPYFITLNVSKAGLEDIKREILSLCSRQLQPEELVRDADIPMLLSLEKYNEFVPSDLLLKSFAHDYLDLNEMKQLLSEWR